MERRVIPVATEGGRRDLKVVGLAVGVVLAAEADQNMMKAEIEILSKKKKRRK